MVTQKNFSMKNVIPSFIQAAKLAEISYSTAKKIFTNFRSTLKTVPTSRISSQTDRNNMKTASFQEISIEQPKKMIICCLIGGAAQNRWRQSDAINVRPKGQEFMDGKEYLGQKCLLQDESDLWCQLNVFLDETFCFSFGWSEIYKANVTKKEIWAQIRINCT